ncbi:MAG: homoserine dehydrogenase [Planctomycetes bacterium]|nr:homoserine dehydrogenase [Planctomycetota bacterium]MCB9903092.1 homoserine dehydrogenase [Planctomycetota bacterium]
MSSPLTVLKFGSSVLRSAADLPRAVHEIYSERRAGRRVLCVVSALGDTTDRLLRRAESWRSSGDELALAALLATGEAEATALLALALARAGLSATRLDVAAAGIACDGPRLDARPTSVSRTRVFGALEAHGVVVLPGFYALDEDGQPALFGRGGSDLTAIFLAERLGAQRCVLLKDVDGLYESDPARAATKPKRFAALRYESALALGDGVVQDKAIRHAAATALRFEVGSLGRTQPSLVGAPHDRFVDEAPRRRPLRVALAGLGTVGEGVRRLLAAEPDEFELVGALVRDPRRASRRSFGDDFCVDALEPLLLRDPDVFVELIGGLDPAEDLVRAALHAGLDVVTANKALLARRGLALETLASSCGARISASAAVAGAVPALELVERTAAAGRLRGFDGVLNGTTNAVLDAICAGASFDEAVAAAQRAGFAEADPTLDLDGTDAAQKLELLARAAFAGAPPVRWRSREGIAGLDAESVRRATRDGTVPRLVASCVLEDGKPCAELRVVQLPPHHPLAQVRGEENALLVHDAGGATTRLFGKGAGRWPTAQAVFADLQDLARSGAERRALARAE